MNFRKCLISSIVSALTLMSISVVNASAATSPWIVGNQYWRSKNTTSGVYVSNSSSIYNVSVSVYGENSITGTDKFPVGYNTTDLIFIPQIERLIRQYICEWGYPYAHIIFNNPTGNYNAACGNWDPDPDNTYPYIN